MKTTIEIPDELFRKAKATAALRGESLKDLICDAIEARVSATPEPQGRGAGWRMVFGLADARSVAKIDRLIAEEFERVDPADWR